MKKINKIVENKKKTEKVVQFRISESLLYIEAFVIQFIEQRMSVGKEVK